MEMTQYTPGCAANKGRRMTGSASRRGAHNKYNLGTPYWFSFVGMPKVSVSFPKAYSSIHNRA
jgi:hypothetical protein